MTKYSSVSLGGALPNWVVNGAAVDMPAAILKVGRHLNALAEQGKLARKGVLSVPPELLKTMKSTSDGSRPAKHVAPSARGGRH